MTNLKNIIIAAATSMAVLAPLAGAAEANYNGFNKRDRHVVVRRNGIHKIRRNDGRSYRRAVFTPRIDERIERQERRIRRGRRSGRITRTEGIRLRTRLFGIKSARSFARVDGRVTFTERRRLMDMLDANSKRISRLAHNGRGKYRRY